MHQVEKGLVLRAVNYREADAMLTILTECQGKIAALASGVRRKSSRMSAAVQGLAYSEFTLYETSGRYTINDAELLEAFYDLRGDLEKLSLANYFAEVLEQAADEEISNPELLRLGLNSLYALSKNAYDKRIVKAAFELKVAAFAGYSPTVTRCAGCGCEIRGGRFSLSDGLCYCEDCVRGGLIISSGVASAMDYILKADVRKLFSFKLGEDGLRVLGNIAEAYLSEHFGRQFRTLSFYKSIL